MYIPKFCTKETKLLFLDISDVSSINVKEYTKEYALEIIFKDKYTSYIYFSNEKNLQEEKENLCNYLCKINEQQRYYLKYHIQYSEKHCGIEYINLQTVNSIHYYKVFSLKEEVTYNLVFYIKTGEILLAKYKSMDELKKEIKAINNILNKPIKIEKKIPKDIQKIINNGEFSKDECFSIRKYILNEIRKHKKKFYIKSYSYTGKRIRKQKFWGVSKEGISIISKIAKSLNLQCEIRENKGIKSFIIYFTL